MFNRSRKKIILAIMGSLVLLLAVTLAVILFASYRDIQKRSADMLHNYTESYFLEQKPREPGGPGLRPQTINPPPNETPFFLLSTFYSVALAEDGTVIKVDDGMKDVYGEEELIRFAKDILAKKKTSGRIKNLLFQVVPKGGYTLVAFMDNTVTDSSMHTLLRYILLVGGCAIAALFCLSLYLSKRIIRPLEENDRQQKQFISDASHELKTPISVISANAELLSREMGENEWLANIQYENERMGELVRQLLDLSRAENAQTPVEHVDFSRIVTGEALAFESLAFDRGRALQSDIEPGICLIGNRLQLAQLVSILLDNAIKHSTGGVIELSLRRQAHTVVFSVTNEGDPIPLEKQPHLFDRFYRSDEARSDEEQHYGLGLAISKAVVEQHGGSISVSCQKGKVRFTVYLHEK